MKIGYFADGEWSCYNVRSYDDAYLERVEIPEGSINDWCDSYQGVHCFPIGHQNHVY